MSAGSLLYVDDDTVASVVGAPHGALVLAKDDCENCAAYMPTAFAITAWVPSFRKELLSGQSVVRQQ